MISPFGCGRVHTHHGARQRLKFTNVLIKTIFPSSISIRVCVYVMNLGVFMLHMCVGMPKVDCSPTLFTGAGGRVPQSDPELSEVAGLATQLALIF